ncbi:hypothetical protein SDC9_172887 [bioreactor metagenome]|uniref:Phage XkdN-like protein n=1 Tax=bioreactor metagenome TaxID=1076179 RepID=A0A645GF00_9ZZZZ
MSDVLDRLLKPEVEIVSKNLPRKGYRMKRLSEQAGEDVVFTVQALPYGRIEEIVESGVSDVKLHTVLAGVVEPDLKSPALREKFGGATPAETVKAMLLSGEVLDLARAIERLTGYGSTTIQEIKKN